MTSLADEMASLPPAVVVHHYFPMCARCRRKVDRLHCVELVASCTLRFTAHCHGEQEVTDLPAYLFAQEHGPTPGWAFRPEPAGARRPSRLRRSLPACAV